jgi:hypothetical protein
MAGLTDLACEGVQRRPRRVAANDKTKAPNVPTPVAKPKPRAPVAKPRTRTKTKEPAPRPQASNFSKTLLSGAAALQTVLTLFGASNGGFTAVALNHPVLLIIGIVLVGLGVLCGLWILLSGFEFHKAESCQERIVPVAGVLSLVLGIGITGFIVLLGPAVARVPAIDVALTGTPSNFALDGEVKVGGIKQEYHYWVEVDARKAAGNGSYKAVEKPLYLAQLGADSQGNIDMKFAITLIPHGYQAVSVEAWYGDHSGPCGSLAVTGGANLTEPGGSADKLAEYLDENSRPGCVVVRLPEAAPAKPPAKAKKTAIGSHRSRKH